MEEIEKVYIDKSEYDDLLRIKQQYYELLSMNSRGSIAYKKYEELKALNEYIQANQPVMYKDLKKSFKQFKELGIIG